MQNHDEVVREHLEDWLLGYFEDGDGTGVPPPNARHVASRLARAERCLRLMATAWSTDRTNDQRRTISPICTPSRENQEWSLDQVVTGQPTDPSSLLSTQASSVMPESRRETRDLQFGRFIIRSQRGCGGQGMVYHAYDPMLERDVALKIPHPQWLATPDCRQRFVQECQILARLSHSHLTTVFEAATDGVICWMTCEYCAGPSLAAWLKERRVAPSPRDAAMLIRELAKTVEYIHSHGIIHRDIKPGNILLEARICRAAVETRDVCLSSFLPKLTDFGLARLPSGAETHTKTGAVLGTPAYMSPEQVEGRRADVGVATDVYAIGAVLYELITGRPPMRGRSELDVLRQVADGNIVAPRQVEPRIPVDLESICLKCLEHRTERRYESAAELARDLDRFLAHKPVDARRPSQLARFGKWSRRNPLVASLSAIIVVGLLSGLAVVAWQWHQTRGQYLRAERNFDQALEAVSGFHELLYEGSDADAPQFRQLRKSMTESAIRHYQTLLTERPQDRMILRAMADAYRQFAFVHFDCGEDDQAIKFYEKALAIWQQLADEGVKDGEMCYFVAQTHGRMGHLLCRQGRLDEALRHVGIAYEIGQELALAKPTAVEPAGELSECLSVMSKLYQHMGRLNDAVSAAREAIRIRTEIVERQPKFFHHQRRLAEAYLGVAGVFITREEFMEATEACLNARQILQELVECGEEFPWSVTDLAQSLRLLGYLRSQANDQNESLIYYVDACQLLERLCAEPSGIASFGNQLADSLTELALHERVCGQLDAAIEHHRRARDAYAALTDRNQRALSVMKSNFHLGQLYLEKQLPTDAAAHFRLAIRSLPDASANSNVNKDAQYFLTLTKENLHIAELKASGIQHQDRSIGEHHGE